jgi:predicted PurR-regulated permease PerM
VERRVEQIAQIAAIAVLVVGCLLVLQPFVTALLSAAIVCFSTWPMYKRVERWLRGRRWLAALVMTLTLILIIVLPLALLALTIADSVTPAVDKLQEFLAAGLPGPPDWLRGIPLIGDHLDTGWRELAASETKFNAALERLAQPAQQGLLQFGLILGEGVLQLTLAAFIGYFFYRDGEALVGAMRAATRHVAGHLMPELFQTVGGTIKSVVYGLLGTALAQGVVAAIGFMIAGVPAALLLGSATFFLSLLPIGPPLIWGGATAWLAYQGQLGWAVFMAIYGFFAISGIDNVVKPLLISRGSSLPFVLVFIGVFGGVIAFGFVGIFIGPTLLAVGFALAQRWTRPSGAHMPPPV